MSTAHTERIVQQVAPLKPQQQNTNFSTGLVLVAIIIPAVERGRSCDSRRRGWLRSRDWAWSNTHSRDVWVSLLSNEDIATAGDLILEPSSCLRKLRGKGRGRQKQRGNQRAKERKGRRREGTLTTLPSTIEPNHFTDLPF